MRYLLLFAALPLWAVPTMANLWVDTNGGTCTRQSTAGAYIDAQACSSMQTALTAASAGDTVIIKNGSYGAQTLSTDQKASAVSFYAETSGSVTLTGDLTVHVDKVHIYGVVSAAAAFDSRHDLEVLDSTVTAFTDVLIDGWSGRSAFLAASGLTIQNSEIGNGYGCNASHQEDAVQFWGWGPSLATKPTNFNFLHNIVHDWTADAGGTCTGGQHVDGFQNYPGSSEVLIDGNLFYNNATSNILTEGISGSWVIQNNYFGPPYVAGNNLVIGRGDCSGVVIQYNVMDFGAVNNDVSCTGTSYIVRGNIFPSAVTSCGTNTATFNVFPASGGSTCGTNTKRCTPTWVLSPPSAGGAQPNPTLQASDTCARDAGSSVYPSTDFYGTVRPQGAAADAGPYEYTPTAGPSGVSGGKLTFGGAAVIH